MWEGSKQLQGMSHLAAGLVVGLRDAGQILLHVFNARRPQLALRGRENHFLILEPFVNANKAAGIAGQPQNLPLALRQKASTQSGQ